MRPICVPCQRFYHCETNDYCFEERRPEINKLWNGDKFRCPTCKTTIIVGVAEQPLACDTQSDYYEIRDVRRPEIRVTDSRYGLTLEEIS